jgi:hypothetical protein
MNGVLCVNASSGQLLYARALAPGFGVLESSDDAELSALRLASTIFAWHVNALEVGVAVYVDADDGGGSQLTLYSIGNAAMHVHAVAGTHLLIVIVTTSRIAHERALAMAARAAAAYAKQLGVLKPGLASGFSRGKFAACVTAELQMGMPAAYLDAALAALPCEVHWAWAVSLCSPLADDNDDDDESIEVVLNSWALMHGTEWPVVRARRASAACLHWLGQLFARSLPASVPPRGEGRVGGPWRVARSAHGGLAAPPPGLQSVPSLLRLLERMDGVERGAERYGSRHALALGADAAGGAEQHCLLLRRGGSLLVLSHADVDRRSAAFVLAVSEIGALLDELDVFAHTTAR